MSKFISKRFDSLREYVPGEQPTDKRYIKLNTNESPFSPDKNVADAVACEAEFLNLYPDPTLGELKSRLAKIYGVSASSIFIVNGSDEALSFAFMAFCDEITGVAYPSISYGFYRVFADLYRLDRKEIPLKSDFTIEPSDYYGIGRTIFIANPNAPTGIALTVSQIEEILKRSPDNIVVIDEAYVDFGGESCIPLISEYPNLLVVQTFSKSRSLAGGRLGFAIGAPEIIADLEKLRFSTNPYNIDRLTIAAGCAVLDRNETYMDNCRTICENRDFLTDGLNELGFEVLPSKANFVFAKSDKIDGGELYIKLKENGILVRHFDTAIISQYNRITVGTRSQCEALLAACRNILNNNRFNGGRYEKS